MNDVDFEQAKSHIEAESGPLSEAEQVQVKGLFYFAKGVELRNELKRRVGIFGAVRAFLSGQKRRQKSSHGQAAGKVCVFKRKTGKTN